MPSYTTLAVLALAASSVSPALSAPIQVAREQAPNYHELVSGKRGLFGFGGGGATKLAGDEAAKATEGAASKGWGSKAKNFLLSLVIGGVAASAGTDIYSHMNPNSPALGGSGGSGSTSSTTTGSSTTGQGSTTGPGYATTGPSYATGPATGPGYATGPATSPGYTSTGPGYTSTGPGYTSNGPGYASNGPGYASTGPGYAATGPGYATTGSNYPTTSQSGSTAPWPSGTGTTATRAIGERDREERALDHNSPVDISTRSNSNLNSRASPHMNSLSRGDLEKAISLFSRMLDELD